MPYLKFDLLNVYEPRRLHPLPLQVLLYHQKGPPKLLARFNEKLAPLAERGAIRQITVVALDKTRPLKALYPAARAADFIRLGEKGVPVGDGAYEPAHVDVVDRVCGEGPLAGEVFNFATGR